MDAHQAGESSYTDGNGSGSPVQDGTSSVLDNKFLSRDELLQVVKDIYFKKGYALSIKSSRKDKYVTVGCDRGGQYRDKQKTPIELRQRKRETRLQNCPFEIQGRREEDGFWIVVVRNNSHNHDATLDMCGHPSARVLSKEETNDVDKMTRAGIAPKQILSSLRQKNPNLQVVARNIYNAKGKILRESLAGRSSIHVLYEELGKGGFTFDIKRDGMDRVTHLFFVHPTSVKLSRSYSSVFVMDCTYKTNRYHMPLLEIIGVTSFNTSFFSSFAFLKNEGYEDYVWALNAFSKVLGSTCQPMVIVTDRELALMKAIKVVFPKAVNLLCVWHIQKNIVTNCKSNFEKEEDFDKFLSTWNEVVYSSTDESFTRSWEGLELAHQHKINVLNYIRKTWLPYKEQFVSAWTEKYSHFGNRATSRAEGAHSKRKRYLFISTGDLRAVKDKMIILIENDRREIKTKLLSERITVPLNCNIPFFKEVVMCISSFSLQKLHEQYEKLQKGKMSTTCTGEFVATMGLPCAHMMVYWKDTSLPLGAIHSQWRIDIRSSLFVEDEVNQEENGIFGLFSELQNKYNQLPLIEREDTREKLSQLVGCSTPLVFEPNIQVSKGRPSGVRKRKVSSTRRDPLGFEFVETSRKCSICRDIKHNSRTCPIKNRSSLDDGRNINLDDGGYSLIDLNMALPNDNSFGWDLEPEELR